MLSDVYPIPVSYKQVLLAQSNEWMNVQAYGQTHRLSGNLCGVELRPPRGLGITIVSIRSLRPTGHLPPRGPIWETFHWASATSGTTPEWGLNLREASIPLGTGHLGNEERFPRGIEHLGEHATYTRWYLPWRWLLHGSDVGLHSPMHI